MENIKEFLIKGLILDPTSSTPIVILQDVEETTIIPIWIGLFEANAIAVELEHIETPRPLTHDLLRNILQHFAVAVEKVVVSNLEDNTYFAEIHLVQGVERSVVDSRPSDALALAVRMKAKIFVAENVIQKSRSYSTVDKENPTEEELHKWLEELPAEEMGKYRM